MCNPVLMAVGMVGLRAVQTGLQFSGEQQYAHTEQNAINANLRNQYQQSQQQIIWHDQEAAQKLDVNARALRAAQGRLTAAAAENGVGGNSIFALANELNANAGHYASDVQYNREAQDEEIKMQMQGMQADAQSRLNTLPQPSPL